MENYNFNVRSEIKNEHGVSGSGIMPLSFKNVNKEAALNVITQTLSKFNPMNDSDYALMIFDRRQDKKFPGRLTVEFKYSENKDGHCRVISSTDDTDDFVVLLKDAIRTRLEEAHNENIERSKTCMENANMKMKL